MKLQLSEVNIFTEKIKKLLFISFLRKEHLQTSVKKLQETILG